MVSRMNSPAAETNEMIAYRAVAKFVGEVGGVHAFTKLCFWYHGSQQVSQVAKCNLIQAFERLVIRMHEQADALRERQIEAYEQQLTVMTPEQKAQERLRLAKAEMRAAGYLFKRRPQLDATKKPRTEGDRRVVLAGLKLVVATITHLDRRSLGDEESIDVMLREIRRQYLDAAARQQGRDVRFHVGLSIEENRETQEYLSGEPGRS